jgi:hypothetical protein
LFARGRLIKYDWIVQGQVGYLNWLYHLSIIPMFHRQWIWKVYLLSIISYLSMYLCIYLHYPELKSGVSNAVYR